MGGTRVYVGGLPYGVREKDLERFFKGYGRIRDILIKNGYGFVEFDDHRDADDAVYELNGKDLIGERVFVQLAHASSRGGGGGRDGSGPNRSNFRDSRDRRGSMSGRGGGGGGDRRKSYGPPTRTEYRLVVENLSSRVSWQDLKDYMRQAGEVTYADAHKQRRNEGVVEFASHSDMKAAMDKLDDTDLNGRRIRLVEERGGRSGGGGRGRRSKSSSRSKSRSRSRSRRRDSKSKSRSRSKSKSKSRSKSGSKSRSRSKSPGSHGKSKSKSRSPVRKEKKESKSRSRSRSRSVSKSRDNKSRSRSGSPGRDSRSRSKSPDKNGDRDMSPEKDD